MLLRNRQSLKLQIRWNKANTITLILFLTLGFLTVLMAMISAEYLPFRTDVGFLILKEEYLPIKPWLIAFFIHVYTSLWVLLAGFTQFSRSFLKKWPPWHRRLGYLYVVNILLVTGPASLLMGFYANGGLTSRVGFVLLALLWLFFTGMALVKAKQKNFTAHRHYMMRSFALTLSALTLRAWKWGIGLVVEMPPMDRYRLIAWLGWTLNLAVAEWLIWREVKGAVRRAL
jgi:hypothetical protein